MIGGVCKLDTIFKSEHNLHADFLTTLYNKGRAID